MRLLKLSEIAALEPGEVVPGLKCQVKSVGKFLTGTNDKGDWTIQKCTVMDDTAVMTMKLFNQAQYTKQWEGVWIVCESTPGKGGKLGGLLVVDDEYQGKVERQCHVKFGATIAQATDEAPEPAAPAAPAPAKAVAPVRQAAPPAAVQAAISQSAPSPVKVAPAPVPGPKKTVQEAGQDVRAAIANAKGRLGQQCNALIMAYHAAVYIGEQVMTRHPDVPAMFTPDILQKLAVTLAIELNRSGLVIGLPAGPLDAWTRKPEPAKPVEPPPPEPEATDDVAF